MYDCFRNKGNIQIKSIVSIQKQNKTELVMRRRDIYDPSLCNFFDANDQ